MPNGGASEAHRKRSSFEAQRGASMGIRDACEVYRGASDAHVERVVSRLCNVPQGWCAACGK